MYRVCVPGAIEDRKRLSDLWNWSYRQLLDTAVYHHSSAHQ